MTIDEILLHQPVYTLGPDVQFRVLPPRPNQVDWFGRDLSAAALFKFTLAPSVVRLSCWIDDLAANQVCMQESFECVANDSGSEFVVVVPFLQEHLLVGHTVHLHADVQYEGRTERYVECLYPHRSMQQARADLDAFERARESQ